MAFKLDFTRVEILGGLFNKYSFLANRFEEADPQFKAVSEIVRRIGGEEAFIAVVGTALVSYMLSLRGEEHWFLLAKYSKEFSNGVLLLEKFVEESPSLRFNRKTRLNRVKIFANRIVPIIREEKYSLLKDLRRLHSILYKGLSVNPDAKTIVFAVKMAYYVAKALGLKGALPKDISIPVDHRVCLVSLTSGIIRDLENNNWGRRANILRNRNPSIVRTAWHKVSSISCIPAISIDTVLWLVGGCIEKCRYRYHCSIECSADLIGGLDELELLEELVCELKP